VSISQKLTLNFNWILRLRRTYSAPNYFMRKVQQEICERRNGE